MADATMPTAGNYYPGHAPVWLRVRREQVTPGRVVEITDVQGGLITIRDGSTTEALWTHPTAARAGARLVVSARRRRAPAHSRRAAQSGASTREPLIRGAKAYGLRVTRTAR